MTEKKSFFKPIKQSCIHEKVCADYRKKCKACGFNPNNLQKTGMPEKRTMQGFRDKLGQQYNSMPDEFKFT